MKKKNKTKKLGIKDFNKKYNIDMVRGDVIFCATGVITKGVKDLGNEFEVTTFALHKSKKINKIIRNIYNKWICFSSSRRILKNIIKMMLFFLGIIIFLMRLHLNYCQ